jgi:hypothetical protein
MAIDLMHSAALEIYFLDTLTGLVDWQIQVADAAEFRIPGWDLGYTVFCGRTQVCISKASRVPCGWMGVLERP